MPVVLMVGVTLSAIASAGGVERADWLADLTEAIGDRRIVQLGESGHGVSEFYTTKTEIVRELHQNHGFDVLAVEGGVADCEVAWRLLDEWTANAAMRACFWDTWASEEAEALFAYLKQRSGSDRPLRLVGFDNLPTSTAFGDWLSTEEVVADDLQVSLVEAERAFVRMMSGAVGDPDALDELHRTATVGFAAAASELEGQDPKLDMILRSRLASLDFDPRTLSRETLVAMRDPAMAGLMLDHLRAHPESKVIVWAHNAHVAKAYSEFVGGIRRQGEIVHDAIGNQLYTLGIYSGTGRAFAWFENADYALESPRPDSLEGRLLGDSGDVIFADFDALRASGSEWIGGLQDSFEWGRSTQRIVPDRMYDGVLVIREVSPVTRTPMP